MQAGELRRPAGPLPPRASLHAPHCMRLCSIPRPRRSCLPGIPAGTTLVTPGTKCWLRRWRRPCCVPWARCRRSGCCPLACCRRCCCRLRTQAAVGAATTPGRTRACPSCRPPCCRTTTTGAQSCAPCRCAGQQPGCRGRAAAGRGRRVLHSAPSLAFNACHASTVSATRRHNQHVPWPSLQADFKQLVKERSGFEYRAERPNATDVVRQKWAWSGYSPGAVGGSSSLPCCMGRHAAAVKRAHLLRTAFSFARPCGSFASFGCISVAGMPYAGDWMELEVDTRADAGNGSAASSPVVVALSYLRSYQVRLSGGGRLLHAHSRQQGHGTMLALGARLLCRQRFPAQPALRLPHHPVPTCSTWAWRRQPARQGACAAASASTARGRTRCRSWCLQTCW